MVREKQQNTQSSVLNPESCIFVAGHRGMVGSAIVRKLRAAGYAQIVERTHGELDLTDQKAVSDFFRKEAIDCVILAAARVGGIHANNIYPAEFIRDNVMIEANVIHEAYAAGVQQLLFLGSSCIYPKYAPQPMKEEYLLTGLLEPTNEPYAVAKITGIKLCGAYNRQYGTKYRSVMPTNLYGPGDNYDLENSHVLPAMIRKFHLAKLAVQNSWEAIQKDEACHGSIPRDMMTNLKSISAGGQSMAPAITFWGTGTPRREFLHVDDLASACVFLMQQPDQKFNSALTAAPDNQKYASKASAEDSEKEAQNPPFISHINIGAGTDVSIAEAAVIVRKVVAVDIEIAWDHKRPDGTPQKLLDVGRLNSLGWEAQIPLVEGLKKTYQAYRAKLDVA